MFDLVADVARYGEFLPWISAVRIRSDGESEVLADLIVGFKGLRETFTSRVQKTRPKLIEVDYVDGPLKYLHNRWEFADASQGSSLSFTVDFAFKSRFFEALAGRVFERALNQMTQAFVDRAEALYGTESGIKSSSATKAA